MQVLKILIGLVISASIIGFGYRIEQKCYKHNTKNKIENQIQEQKITIPYKKYMGVYELTFYTYTGHNTATGVYPKSSITVAVDKNIIPLGSILYIEGYGVKIAQDTGGKIKGNIIDIFVDTKNEAIQNGRKKAKVYILN